MRYVDQQVGALLDGARAGGKPLLTVLVGDHGEALGGHGEPTHGVFVYDDTILVPLGFIALVKTLARAMDAITDPVMGWVSDRTRSPFGRRRPWIDRWRSFKRIRP